MLTKECLRDRFLANDTACIELMKVLDLFSSKTRFRILCVLREQDFCVSDIAEIVEEGKISNISQQLKIMTMSNIISRYRVDPAAKKLHSLDGNEVSYDLLVFILTNMGDELYERSGMGDDS